MSCSAKEITSISIEEELKNSYLDYAMSVIVGRALPDVRDGLKPVHRRILYSMNISGNNWNKPYKKSARIVGDVIGKYHPHGDSAVYDAIVRMAQPFSLRYILIDGQGNFGSIDGDSAAAMRYTEIRLSKIAHELMIDIEKETVNFTENYDSTEMIPDVMPTRIPNLLINGSSGIAVGMATNIPPHNITEVINGCLAFIENKNISIEELMKYIPGPDFPTAAIINGCNGIKDAYCTGRGKIYIRARTKINLDIKTGRETIIIYEIPYQVNKSHLIEKIAELAKDKRIEGISSLRDESDKDGTRIVIEVKKNVTGEVVLNHLYHHSQLEISFGINMVALKNGQPKIFNLKEIIEAFIMHRREIITKRTIFNLKKAKERLDVIEVLIFALNNIDQIIEIIRKAPDAIKAKDVLINHKWDITNFSKINDNNIILSNDKRIESKFNIKDNYFFITEKQAQIILDLRLQKLNNLENKRLFNEYTILLNQISEYFNILNNVDYLMNIVSEELKTIKDQFGDLRRTLINVNNNDIKMEDLINQENVVVTLSYQGYVKYQPLDDYEAQRRGGKGKSAASIKKKDFIDRLLVTNTHDTILCFSSRGRLYWMKVYQLPEANRSSRGRPIVNLLPLEQNERITAILPLREYEEGVNVFMATASGIVKKISLKEFSRPRSTGIIAINLNEGDELIGVDLTSGSDEVMLFSALGKVVRFKENTVRSMTRTAIGVRGIKLADQDKIVSLIIPKGNGTILTITKNGYGKRTSESEYPTKSRGTKGVISIKVTQRNGFVVGAVQVNDYDQIIMITNVGTLLRIRVSEISIVGRNTHGVILIRTSTERDETIVGLQRVDETINDEDLDFIE